MKAVVLAGAVLCLLACGGKSSGETLDGRWVGDPSRAGELYVLKDATPKTRAKLLSELEADLKTATLEVGKNRLTISYGAKNSRTVGYTIKSHEGTRWTLALTKVPATSKASKAVATPDVPAKQQTAIIDIVGKQLTLSTSEGHITNVFRRP